MQGLDLIVTALVSGAGLAAAEAASGVGRDLYEQLKGMVRRRLPDGERALLDAAPATDMELDALRIAICDSGIAADETALQLATRLLESQMSGPRFSTVIHGDVKGLVQGDSNQVHLDFREVAGGSGDDDER